MVPLHTHLLRVFLCVLLDSLGCEVSMLALLPLDKVDLDMAKYPRVSTWMQRLRSIPGWAKVRGCGVAAGSVPYRRVQLRGKIRTGVRAVS